MAYRKKTEPTKTIRLTLDEIEYNAIVELSNIENKAVARYLVDFLRDANVFSLFKNMTVLLKQAQEEKEIFKNKFDSDDKKALNYIFENLTKDFK